MLFIDAIRFLQDGFSIRHNKCANCKFWNNSTTSALGSGDDGLCRVNPPVADDRSGVARWPFVVDTDWCGAFAPSPHAVDPDADEEPIAPAPGDADIPF